MPQIRLLRWLLPSLLGLVVIGLLLSWDPPVPIHRAPVESSSEELRKAEGVNYVVLVGANQDLRLKAEEVKEGQDGSLRARGIERIEIDRGRRGPLVVSAGLGEGHGPLGSRQWTFEQEVVLHDPDEGLQLRVARVEVDETAREARAAGAISLSGPNLSGTATSLRYGFAGQPGEIGAPRLHDVTGSSMRAERMVLHDALRDFELVGSVELTAPQGHMTAASIRIQRSDGGKIERVVATGSVRASWTSPSNVALTASATRLDVELDATGMPLRLGLHGDAVLLHGVDRLLAGRIDAEQGGEGQWELRAADEATIEVRNELSLSTSTLRAATLEATLDRSFEFLRARAEGGVVLKDGTSAGEAHSGSIEGPAHARRIVLLGRDTQKARLAHGRMRIAAARIVTDPRGDRLDAEGRVEATLLPGDNERRGGAPGPFSPAEAVHFVAASLQSLGRGSRLTFRGAVRAWQGQRHLGGERIEIDEPSGSLVAVERVTTRLPRDTVRSLADTDFIHVSAGELNYDDRASRAVYAGEVRVRLTEGWLETRRLEVELAPTTRRVREVRATGDVELALTAQRDGSAPPEQVDGQGDRLAYAPEDGIVRLFGDQAPATVRRTGIDGVTTSGRVLRYDLAMGTVEVEADSRGPARIRTPGA